MFRYNMVTSVPSLLFITKRCNKALIILYNINTHHMFICNIACYICVSCIENICTIYLVYNCEKLQISLFTNHVFHDVSTPLPKPDHLSGTGKKYRCIAAMKRARYSSGDIIVGNFPWPPNIPDFFTIVSNFLSQVNVRM